MSSGKWAATCGETLGVDDIFVCDSVAGGRDIFVSVAAWSRVSGRGTDCPGKPLWAGNKRGNGSDEELSVDGRDIRSNVLVSVDD